MFFFSLSRQCKQTCLRRWDICCMRVSPAPTQTMWHGHTHWLYNYVISPFSSRGAGTPRTPGSCARTIGEFLSKQEARMGQKRLQHQRGPLTLHQHLPPCQNPPKTDCCETGVTQKRGLPASLCRTAAAAVGLHWRCPVFSTVKTQFWSIEKDPQRFASPSRLSYEPGSTSLHRPVTLQINSRGSRIRTRVLFSRGLKEIEMG